MFNEYIILKLDDIIFYAVILTVFAGIIMIHNGLMLMLALFDFNEPQISEKENNKEIKEEINKRVKRNGKIFIISLVIFLLILLIPILLPSTKDMREIINKNKIENIKDK